MLPASPCYPNQFTATIIIRGAITTTHVSLEQVGSPLHLGGERGHLSPCEIQRDNRDVLAPDNDPGPGGGTHANAGTGGLACLTRFT